jgi:hypothetical protein
VKFQFTSLEYYLGGSDVLNWIQKVGVLLVVKEEFSNCSLEYFDSACYIELDSKFTKLIVSKRQLVFTSINNN